MRILNQYIVADLEDFANKNLHNAIGPLEFKEFDNYFWLPGQFQWHFIGENKSIDSQSKHCDSCIELIVSV